MNDSKTDLSPETITEIERHKYFLSEKAGYDVGWDFAEQDWLAHFAESSPAGSSRVDPGTTDTPKSGLSRFLQRRRYKYR